MQRIGCQAGTDLVGEGFAKWMPAYFTSGWTLLGMVIAAPPCGRPISRNIGDRGILNLQLAASGRSEATRPPAACALSHGATG